MAIYELGLRTAAAAAGAAYIDLATGASLRAEILEIGITNTTGTACAIGLNRTTAVGTRTSPVLGLAVDPNAPAATAGAATAWSGAPTLATNYLRRVALPGNGGFVWVWQPGQLILSVSTSIVIANPTGTGQILDVYLKWFE